MWIGDDHEHNVGYDISKDKIAVIKSQTKTHKKSDIKNRGEVFTPEKLVNEMLDKLPVEMFTDKDKLFLDNSCGNGNFLYEVLRRKVKHLMDVEKYEKYKAHRQALSTIYGVELDHTNAEDCRLRLLKGSESNELREIVDNNIICADGLDQNHRGWAKTGFYWDKNIMPVIKEDVIDVIPIIDDVPEPTIEYKTLPMTITHIYKTVDEFKHMMQKEIAEEEAF